MNARFPHRLAGTPITAALSDQSSPLLTGAAVTPETGWGGYALKAPLCRECGRSVYECFCGEWASDDEMMPVADMKLAMPELFTGCELAERSAHGMPGVAK